MKTLINLLTVASLTMFAAGISSCGCCTGEAKVPPLQPLPQFQEIPQVEYSGK